MDIRFINSKNEIINATNLSIKVSGRYLIGESNEGNVVQIEWYKTEEEAGKELDNIGKALSMTKEDTSWIIFNLKKGF